MASYKVLGILLFVAIMSERVNGQGANPAKIDFPKVKSAIGKEAKLGCSTSNDGSSESNLSKLRFCVWERLHQDRSPNTFIVNFNEINSQPGLYSGMRGYSYSGDGFKEGDCGVKISFVKAEDFAKWQCTLITDDKVYRGYVRLEKELPPTTTSKPLGIASSRIEDSEPSMNANDDNRPRPIITSYNDARAIIQPEIIIHTTNEDGTQLIQEVKVESAGLQIKPRRQGKLIVFE